MAATNPVLSGLSAYVQENNEALIREAVLGAKSISKMNVQTGIKGSANLHLVKTDPQFQDGSDCGFTAQGDTTFSERKIETGIIKVNMDICEQKFIGKYTEYQVKLSANEIGKDMPFEQYLIEDILARVGARLEKAVWQGDKMSEDENLKRFDGLLKIINDGDSVKVEIPMGTSAYEAVKSVYKAIPEEVLENAVIYVGADTFRSYLMELTEKNLFHFAPDSVNGEIVIPGTETKLVKLNGLNGSHKIVAADADSLYYGCDLENADEVVKVWYSDDDDLWKVKILFNAGTQVDYPSQIVLGNIAQA